MGRAWAFVIGGNLSNAQREQLASEGERFVRGWTAHNQQLTGRFSIEQGKVILVQVDETVNQASGCSIDKLTRFIKEAEHRYHVTMLDRMLVALDGNGTANVVRAAEIGAMLKDGRLNAESRVIDTTISDTAELEAWIRPLRETWLKRYL